jgi:hypothetical protein
VRRQFRTHWIQRDVPNESFEVLDMLHNLVFEAPLKYMADCTVLGVPPEAVLAVQVLDDSSRVLKNAVSAPGFLLCRW